MSNPSKKNTTEKSNNPPKLAISSGNSKSEGEDTQTGREQINPSLNNINNLTERPKLRFTNTFKKMPSFSEQKKSTDHLYDDKRADSFGKSQEKTGKVGIQPSGFSLFHNMEEDELAPIFSSQHAVELALNTNWEENSPTLQQTVHQWKKKKAEQDTPFDYSIFGGVKYLSIIDVLSPSLCPPTEKKEQFADALTMLNEMELRLESIVIYDFIPSNNHTNLKTLLALIEKNNRTLKKITICNGFSAEELLMIQKKLEQYPHINLKIAYKPIMSPETLKKSFDFFNNKNEKKARFPDSKGICDDHADSSFQLN